MSNNALLIGNSDGIGLAATKRLLSEGWDVVGVSRSDSPIDDSAYRHHAMDVTSGAYPELIASLVDATVTDLCIYFVGVGELLDPAEMGGEAPVVDANLMGMVKTAAEVIPAMAARGQGHFIGLSSVADELVSAEAPSYHASKAGFTNYLAGLSLALRQRGVYVSNVRFGFVDTKMAKGDFKPFMMSVEKAVDHIWRCVRRRPVVYTAPKIVVPLIKFRKWMMRLQR